MPVISPFEVGSLSLATARTRCLGSSDVAIGLEVGIVVGPACAGIDLGGG